MNIVKQAAGEAMTDGANNQRPFGEWLHDELTQRGYDLDGPRAGGKTRFARETGVSLSIISRIFSENRVPEIKALRAIGNTLNIPLGQMLINAGLAEPSEITKVTEVPTAGSVIWEGRIDDIASILGELPRDRRDALIELLRDANGALLDAVQRRVHN